MNDFEKKIDHLIEMVMFRVDCHLHQRKSAQIDVDEAKADLIAAHSETDSVGRWMIAQGYVTGHGDTVEDLLVELVAGVRERCVSSIQCKAEGLTAPAVLPVSGEPAP